MKELNEITEKIIGCAIEVHLDFNSKILKDGLNRFVL